MSNIILDTKNVGKIKGLFYLPDYQRGYRWTSEEIKLLLDDIYESAGKPYCLQPIVVKKSNERFELIDGSNVLQPYTSSASIWKQNWEIYMNLALS